MALTFEPYQIQIPDADLDNLRRRLRATRWPEPEPVEDWSQGIPLGYLQEVCQYRADEYDPCATEQRLNALPQVKTEVDGLGIHLLHLRSPHADEHAAQASMSLSPAARTVAARSPQPGGGRRARA